jgi:hypothetical protein
VKHVPRTDIQQRHTKFNHENSINIISRHFKNFLLHSKSHYKLCFKIFFYFSVYLTVFFILIRSNEMQQYAGVYLLQNYSTCFGCLSHPSSGVHQTVTAASGTGHSVRATTFRHHGIIRPRWRKVVVALPL